MAKTVGKRFLFVISSIEKSGWAEKVAARVAENLYQSGDKVSLLTFYDRKNTHIFSGSYRCLWERVSGNPLRNFLKLLLRAREIAREVETWKIKVAVSFMEEANFPNILAKILFRSSAKTVISLRQSQHILGPLYTILAKILYRFADTIVTVTKEEELNIVRNFWIKKERVITIPNGINIQEIEALKQLALETQDIPLFQSKKFTFVSIGRLTHQKNYSILIRAFKEISVQYPAAQLIIIGDGEMRDELDILIKTQESARDIHLIWKRDNVYPILWQSDCFVLSSLWEWFPNVMIEAMASGLPVISTDCKTGPKEILRKDSSNQKDSLPLVELADYGMLVSSDNSELLSRAMIKMISDSETLGHYQTKSKERVRDYSFETTLTMWQGL